MSKFKTLLTWRWFVPAVLLVCVLISLFFQLYRSQEVPPCFNDDEAAFGYNAYSILQTGKDEHGHILPLRLESYGDFKLPLNSYFMIPFIKLFGLSVNSVRMPNLLLALAFIPLIYFFLKELFKKDTIALVGTFLLSASPWFHLLTRNAHEGVWCSFFLLLSITLILKYSRRFSYPFFFLANAFLLLSTFTYHFARIYLVFLLFWQVLILFQQHKTIFKKQLILPAITLVAVVAIPFLTDLIYGANRVKFLFFVNNIGFMLRLNELLNEHFFRIIHNKVDYALNVFSIQYLRQFSPEFFFFGDKNYRYTYDYVGLITAVEYIGIFVGLFAMFANKFLYRFHVLALLAISAIPNAVTFQDYSLVRNYFMIIPILICCSYGFIYLFEKMKFGYIKIGFVVLTTGLYVFYLANNWDMYLFHYPQKAVVQQVWQCGRKEMATYVSSHYSQFDNFVISNQDGQNYMFLLFFLKYNPQKYLDQHVAYKVYDSGFTTVTHFDKFNFPFAMDLSKTHTAFIGYPSEFNTGMPGFDMRKVKKIVWNNKEVYWVYEN